jgi:hypothetical protein
MTLLHYALIIVQVLAFTTLGAIMATALYTLLTSNNHHH